MSIQMKNLISSMGKINLKESITSWAENGFPSSLLTLVIVPKHCFSHG
jgi:hypothetical protein